MEFYKEINETEGSVIKLPTFSCKVIQLDISCPAGCSLKIYKYKSDEDEKELHFLYDEKLEQVHEITHSGVYIAYVNEYNQLSIETIDNGDSTGFLALSYFV